MHGNICSRTLKPCVELQKKNLNDDTEMYMELGASQILLANWRPSLSSSRLATGGWVFATLAMALFSSGDPPSRKAPKTLPSLIQYEPNLGLLEVGSLSPNRMVSPTLSP